MSDSLKELVKGFFEILDKVEESDNGKLFKPNYITSARVIDTVRLRDLLAAMRREIEEKEC